VLAPTLGITPPAGEGLDDPRAHWRPATARTYSREVPADGGGRVDVAALSAEVAIYVFRPGAWASRSVHLTPGDARRLADDIQQGSAGAGFPSAG